MEEVGGRKRSHIEVKLDVLRAIGLGVNKPTRIMYMSNTSWIVLKNILSDLQTKGLIEEKNAGGRKRYVITEKGMNLLKKYEEISRALNG